MTPAEQFNLELFKFDTAIQLADLEKEKASQRVAELRYRKALFIQQSMSEVKPPEPEASSAASPS